MLVTTTIASSTSEAWTTSSAWTSTNRSPARIASWSRRSLPGLHGLDDPFEVLGRERQLRGLLATRAASAPARASARAGRRRPASAGSPRRSRRKASIAYWSNAVTNTSCDSTSASISRRATSKPVRPGICTSRNTRSGRSSPASRSASTPSAAWPTISTPPTSPEQEAQLLARELLIVHDQNAERRHRVVMPRRARAPRRRARESRSRADVPWSGTLWRRSW